MRRTIEAQYNDLEANYACKRMGITDSQYRDLLKQGIRYLAHGILIKSGWAKSKQVHGGYAYTPIDEEEVKGIINANTSK